MKMQIGKKRETKSFRCEASEFILIFIVLISLTSVKETCSQSNEYQMLNDRILTPDVSHFARVNEPGVDAHGDLSLSIPLLTVPGRDGLDFPITINYSSGIQVTQSASWVGLGWSLDLGSITRHPLGGLANSNFVQVDFASALQGDGTIIESQPDVYMVNMNGSSTLLMSLTKESADGLPFDPAKSETDGPCSNTSLYSQYYFIPSPWKPWKFCYLTRNPVTVWDWDSGTGTVKSWKTGIEGSDHEDFSKIIVTTANGMRYVYQCPTLSHAVFPPASGGGLSNYNFVSTWRLVAVLTPNYTGPDIPDETSNGGWVKIVYRTWDMENSSVIDTVDTIVDNGQIIVQTTFPYYLETPTHFAYFTTSKRYDRDLAIRILEPLSNGDPDLNYYSRKLDKITLLKKHPEYDGQPMPENNPLDSGTPIMDVSFEYMKNGADSFIQYNEFNVDLQKMISKLCLEKISIKGIQGESVQEVPTYEFHYYDDLHFTWLKIAEYYAGIRLFQDDFGFLEVPPEFGGPTSEGWMWSLKDIIYPDGGGYFIQYDNDSLSTLSFIYNRYEASQLKYTHPAGEFTRHEQGGPRVRFIAKFDSYGAACKDTVKFSYGLGHHSSVSEVWFRKLPDLRTVSLLSSGERGQANITYEWVQKSWMDSSAIRTYYVTSDIAEEQTLYLPGIAGVMTLLESNKCWNWGEEVKTEFLTSDKTVKVDFTQWTFRGNATDPDPVGLATISPELPFQTDSTDGFTDPIYLNFTYKAIEKKVSKYYDGTDVDTVASSFEYKSDGTQIAKVREEPKTGAVKQTIFEYAHEVSDQPPYSEMKKKNMRSQLAEKRILLESDEVVSADATAWKVVSSAGQEKYLPSAEFQWKKDSQLPNKDLPQIDWLIPIEENGWTLIRSFPEYDIHGNQKRIHDARNNETTIDWDPTGSLITSVTTHPSQMLSLTTSYDYDLNTFRLTAITDPNGQSTYYEYDPLQRLTAVKNTDGIVTKSFVYHFSRDDGGVEYDPLDPNYIKTMSIPSETFKEEFNYTDDPGNHGWSVYDNTSSGTMSIVYDNVLDSQVLRATASSPSTNFGIMYPTGSYLDTKSPHVWAKIKDSDDFVFYVYVWACDQKGYYVTYHPHHGAPYNTQAQDGTIYIHINLGEEYKDGSWHTIERDLDTDLRRTGLDVDFEYVRWFCLRGDYDLDDIRLTAHPVTEIIYADGLGRDFQTQTPNQRTEIITRKAYNNRGLVMKEYKPAEMANPEHGYFGLALGDLPSEATYSDATVTGVKTYQAGDILTAGPNFTIANGAFVEFNAGSEIRLLPGFTVEQGADFTASTKDLQTYELFEYENNPLARLTKQYHYGLEDFINHRYGIESYNGTQYRYEQIMDERGIFTKSYLDGYGNSVVFISAEDDPLQTSLRQSYDILGNIYQTIQPSGYASYMTYNTLSQLARKTTPDENTTKYIYDKNGNLRFKQDAEQANTGFFSVYYYDPLNRITAIGEERNSTSVWTVNSEPSPDNTTYGTEANEWRVHYVYDQNFVDGVTNYCLGRLTKTEINIDNDDVAEHIIKYVYDKFGNVIEKHVQIDVDNPNAPGEQIICIVYDQLGREQQVIYPSGNTIAKDYDQPGRLKKVISVQ